MADIFTPMKNFCYMLNIVAVRGKQYTPAEFHAAVTWALRLTRVLNIDIETCTTCGGTFKGLGISAGITLPYQPFVRKSNIFQIFHAGMAVNWCIAVITIQFE